MARPETRRKRERGGSVVEVAVAIPILAIMLIGSVDFGRAYYEWIAIENAVAAGARFGSQDKTYASDAEGIRAAVVADLGETLGSSDFEFESERYCECANGGSVDCNGVCTGSSMITNVRVRLLKPYVPLFNYPGIPENLAVTSEAHARVNG